MFNYRALLESASELTQESVSTLNDDESQELEEGGMVEAATDDRNTTTIDSYSQFLFVMNEVSGCAVLVYTAPLYVHVCTSVSLFN